MAAPVRAAQQPAVALAAPPRRRRRWSTGHIVMIIAGLLGATLTLLSLRATDHRVDVAVARTALAPGSRVEASSFTTQRVELGSSLRGVILTPAQARDLAGSTVLIPVGAGEPVPVGALVPAAATNGRRSIGFPIDPERAVGGNLRTGDRVDIYTTGPNGTLIAVAVEVLDVLRQDRGPLAPDGGLTVVLAVDADQAPRIAPVVGSDDLVLVLATGANPATPPPVAASPERTPIPNAAPVAPAAPEGTPGG